MEKLRVEFTLKQRQNLLVFLGRTQLTGNEVPAYNELMLAIAQAKPVEGPESGGGAGVPVPTEGK